MNDTAPATPGVRARKTAQGRRPLDRVVGLQGADGSWDLTDEFAKAIGIGRRELDGEFADVMRELHEALGQLERPGAVGPAEGICRRAFATALALRWLEARCADTRQEWEGLALKAHEWLQRAPLGDGFWLEAAGRSRVLANTRA